MEIKTESYIRKEIAEQESLIVGDFVQDCETRMKIYELKKELNPRIELEPELDDDEPCDSCGS